MRVTLTEYKKFDKIISENEPEFLQERLDNLIYKLDNLKPICKNCNLRMGKNNRNEWDNITT